MMAILTNAGFEPFASEADVSVAALLPASAAARLTELAKATGTGRADLVRKAVLQFLAGVSS
jgi:hypothetical protein